MIQPADVQDACPDCKAKARHVSLPLVPLPPGVKATPNTPRQLRRDLRTLITFVDTYCNAKHEEKKPVELRNIDIRELAGRRVFLCAECTKLLQHALVKRQHCPRDPKPECKHCPTHCYAPKYRAQVREVMKFSGRHLIMQGRLDYLLHLFF